MVVGKDFAKFSNPKYVNKRGSTMTLVREDAESAWDIPDSPKQREHSLSLVKENETENESDKKTELHQVGAQSNMPPPASAEVNVGVEIVPPPRNIARERPKKAKLVKAIDLVDELSDSAFETVTESDLGKRTDSDMSSGNDSTETHTVSLVFKETFDNRHRNTVSVVTETFDSLASERAEHRTSSLPPEISRHTDIPDSVMSDARFIHLSKSMDSELAYANEENISSDFKIPADNKDKRNADRHSETSIELSQVDTKGFNAETNDTPLETVARDAIVSDNIFTENTDSVPKTPPVSPNEFPPETNNLSFSDHFMSGFDERYGESLNGTSDAGKQNQNVEENISAIEKQSNDAEAFGSDTSLSKNDVQQGETVNPETDLSLSMTVGQNDQMDMVDSTELIWQSTATELISSGTDSSLVNDGDMDSGISIKSSLLKTEEVISDLAQLNSDNLIEDKPYTPSNLLETPELVSTQNEMSSEEEDNKNDTSNKANDETNKVTRTASLTLSKDNLFFDAPPTPMIVVQDSFIRDPDAANPFMAIEENENGLPVIKEKSESQSSTRSNSFDFDLVPDLEDSKAATETLTAFNEFKTVKTNENNRIQNESALFSEKDSTSASADAILNENDKMIDIADANSDVQANSNFENPILFDVFEEKQSGVDHISSNDTFNLPSEGTDGLLSETWKSIEESDAFTEGHSEFPQLVGGNFMPLDEKEKVDNTLNSNSRSPTALESNEDENVNIDKSQVKSEIPQQVNGELLPTDTKEAKSVDNTNNLINISAAAPLSTEDNNAVAGGASLGSFIKPDSSDENIRIAEGQPKLGSPQQLLVSDEFSPTDMKEVPSFDSTPFNLISNSAPGLDMNEDQKTKEGGTLADSFIKPDSFSNLENFQPLEIQVDSHEKQTQLLNFDHFEGDNAVSITSPTGISTDSSAISWELISETSPSIVDTNPFQLVNDEKPNSNDQLMNTIDTNILMQNTSNLLDFGTDDSQTQQQLNLLDFDTSGNVAPTDDRKASDSSSSKEGDTSWELIDESVNDSTKQNLVDLGNNEDDASIA